MMMESELKVVADDKTEYECRPCRDLPKGKKKINHHFKSITHIRRHLSNSPRHRNSSRLERQACIDILRHPSSTSTSTPSSSSSSRLSSVPLSPYNRELYESNTTSSNAAKPFPRSNSKQCTKVRCMLANLSGRFASLPGICRLKLPGAGRQALVNELETCVSDVISDWCQEMCNESSVCEMDKYQMIRKQQLGNNQNTSSNRVMFKVTMSMIPTGCIIRRHVFLLPSTMANIDAIDVVAVDKVREMIHEIKEYTKGS